MLESRILSLQQANAMSYTSCWEAVHRQTELFARWLLENPSGKTSFNTPEEAEAVDEVFDSALAGLKPADRDLRIVQGIRGLLRAGIAMHHSGLLPILKEVIEILFQEGLVKVMAAHTRMRQVVHRGCLLAASAAQLVFVVLSTDTMENSISSLCFTTCSTL